VIAALYVERGGTYWDLPGVDPWDRDRDARAYAGPWTVIAHPPCERWGRYWSGGPNPKAARRQLGDDDGCFAAALAAVRQWGGVLEHPAHTHAWSHHGLAKPPREGGWVQADAHGWTCHVEQGHYGHRARKATWLYAVGTELPELTWGPTESKVRMEEGFHSREERKAMREAGHQPIQRINVTERMATPKPFRDLLLGLAESVITRARHQPVSPLT
jgi:hypothetical protein